ncbi:hypothetical protein RRF57_004139 [Xylaria bambusicola]|uniref:C3H1-type domain-containing protein n=1 Tax=Xylaria bambusicola TaxID=326684 RepID=A0AAN7UMH9_9PEZI
MLFDEEDADLIKAWIVKRLENNSDADADVLADYVLALLRHDGDVETIRKLFEEEIPDFLREDAAAFTDDVLQAVRYRSYIPGAPPAPPAPPITRQPRFPPPVAPTHVASRPDMMQPSTALYHPSAPFSEPLAPPPFPQTNSRKRAHNDRDDGDVDIILNSQASYGPPYKQPRRGGGFGQRGGRHEDPYKSKNYRGAPQFPDPASYGAPMPLGPLPIDPNSILENIQLLQSLLPTAADLSPSTYSGNLHSSNRGKRRCRDYERKGHCPRGRNCNFDHEVEQPFILPPMPMAVDEYDPSNAALSLPPFGVQPPPAGQQLNLTNFPLPHPTNRRELKKPRRTKGRPPFAANGPSHDKAKTALVVQNIPSENFSEEQVRRYFGQFGNIVEVQMQHQNRLAIVKFDSWEAANTAWGSPKVIFDNRFVKVFWYKDEGSGATTPNGKRANNAANGQVDRTPSAGDSVPAQPELDVEEFYRKQLEAQRVHDEKTKKRQEIERERQELEERQKALCERQAEAKRQLQAKLKANGLKDGSLSPAGALTEGGDKKPSAETEALRAQLAALEQEANQLGINPDENHDDASSWTLRGRGRGRGYRGRGTFAPRAIRGAYGYRGRGGIVESRHAAYAAYSLDNRPKVVALSGVDFTIPENNESLRQYLFSVGEFKEVHGAPAVTHVTFKDRKTAEKFMFGVSTSNSIHGIEGKIEPTWVKTAPDSVKMADADGGIPIAGTLDDDKKLDAEADDGNEELEEGEIDNTLDHDQGDMDYEAGEW